VGVLRRQSKIPEPNRREYVAYTPKTIPAWPDRSGDESVFLVLVKFGVAIAVAWVLILFARG
jgi:hypothetical protein